MPIERTELSVGETTFTATVESPAGGSDAGVQFLRYQTWDDGEELAAKPPAERHAEVDAALDSLRERGCTRVTLVGKSAGGGIVLDYAPEQADALVLWAPAVFLEDGDVLADLDVPADADPATLPASDLSAIGAQVDILQRDEDRLPVANARELAAEIPDATTHVIEGADHSFVGGQPETETVETTVSLLSQPADAR